MSTTLREHTALLPSQGIVAMIPAPPPRRNCTTCALLQEMAPMIREMITLREKGRASLSGLTPRQRTIVDLVVAGHPSKNIAADLCISQRTVENHRAAIMKRTSTKSLPELSRLVFCATWEIDDDPWV